MIENMFKKKQLTRREIKYKSENIFRLIITDLQFDE